MNRLRSKLYVTSIWWRERKRTKSDATSNVLSNLNLKSVGELKRSSKICQTLHCLQQTFTGRRTAAKLERPYYVGNS